MNSERLLAWQARCLRSQKYTVVPESSSNSIVTLYVVPGCPLCASARAWLESHGIDYRERDVANDFGALRAMYRLTRQRYVPVFEVEERAMVRPGEKELAEFLL